MSNEKYSIEECLFLSINEKSHKKSCCFNCCYYNRSKRYCGEPSMSAWSKENYPSFPAEFHNHCCGRFVDND